MKKNSVKKNYIFNLSYQILAILAPLITTPYVSRVLGVDGVGTYNYTYAITYVFTLVCALGTRAYAQREVAYRQDAPEEYSKVFFEIMMIKAVSFLAVSIVYLITSAVYRTYSIYLLALYLYIIADFFDISWFFSRNRRI